MCFDRARKDQPTCVKSQCPHSDYFKLRVNFPLQVLVVENLRLKFCQQGVFLYKQLNSALPVPLPDVMILAKALEGIHHFLQKRKSSMAGKVLKIVSQTFIKL